MSRGLIYTELRQAKLEELKSEVRKEDSFHKLEEDLRRIAEKDNLLPRHEMDRVLNDSAEKFLDVLLTCELDTAYAEVSPTRVAFWTLTFGIVPLNDKLLTKEEKEKCAESGMSAGSALFTDTVRRKLSISKNAGNLVSEEGNVSEIIQEEIFFQQIFGSLHQKGIPKDINEPFSRALAKCMMKNPADRKEHCFDSGLSVLNEVQREVVVQKLSR